MDIYKMIYDYYNHKKPVQEEKTMDEIIVELDKGVHASMPNPGARDVVIEEVIPQYNNIGQKVVYVQFAYTHKGQTFRWGLTYKVGDAKLNKLFPDGVITQSDVGRTVKVEIQYCMSKNGEYPSIVDLDD